MPSTGEKCQTSGIYTGTCHNQHVKEVALSVGNTFPPCNTGACSGSVTYN